MNSRIVLRLFAAICSYNYVPCGSALPRSTWTGARTGSSIWKNSRGVKPDAFASTLEGNDWILVFSRRTCSL